MQPKSKYKVIISTLWVYVMCFALYPLQAQPFGRTPITLENADTLTLMATYNHMFPAVIALSPDGRWLAVGRRFPEGGAPGAGDGFPPYHAPFEYYDPTAVLVYDMQNLTDEPQLLTGNNRYIKQMVFTDTRLLLLTSNREDDQRLQSWQIEDDTFGAPQVLIEDIDTAFAVDDNDSWMVYFFEGGIYYTTPRRPPEQLGIGRYSGPPHFDNPISLTASNIRPNNDPIAVAVDQSSVVILGNLERTGPYLTLTRDPVTRGLGHAFIDNVNVAFADGSMIMIDVQVATLPLVDVSPDTLIDFAMHPDWNLVATVTDDGDTTRLSLWDITEAGFPNAPAVTTPIWSIARDNLSQVQFSADGTMLLTVTDFGVALWSVPDNLLTPNGASILSQENVLAYCNNTPDDPQSFHRNTQLGIVWSWYATNDKLIADHLDNARYDVRIDDMPLYHWVFVSQVRRAPENDNDPTVYFYAPLDTALSPREHHIAYELTWLNAISDGYETFGPGTDNPDNTGECFLNITE